VPFQVITSKLAPEDDRNYWEAALAVVSEEFIRRHDEQSKGGDWVLVVGACSHWVRPHRSRWAAAGGFAYPNGYQNFLPEFDWSQILVFRHRQWIPVEKLPKKKLNLFRVAIPTRTARHKQAVVHTRWYPGSETVLYGFRNLGGSWDCLAASDEKVRGSIRHNSRSTSDAGYAPPPEKE
jgi:hypothetical protein